MTERTTKTEKFEEKLRKYIVNFKTIGYKLSALSNIIQSNFN